MEHKEKYKYEINFKRLSIPCNIIMKYEHKLTTHIYTNIKFSDFIK